MEEVTTSEVVMELEKKLLLDFLPFYYQLEKSGESDTTVQATRTRSNTLK
jgi:hypothetical protein